MPAPPRLVAADVTTERLVQLMADQGGRMASLSDEGKIIDIISGIYTAKGQAAIHQVFVKGADGGRVTVDRIVRDGTVRTSSTPT